MIELRELPSTIARLIPREFLQWLIDARTRTNYKIDIMPDAGSGNIPYIDANGGLTDSGRTGPTGDFVGTTDTQTLTNKRLELADLNQPTIDTFVDANHDHENAAGGGTLREEALVLRDITTGDVSTSAHGFAPKAPNDTTKYLRGDAAWAVPDHGALGGLADDDHSQYLNTTRHDTPDRHGDAVIFTTAMTEYSGSSTVSGWSSPTVEIWYKKLGKLVFVCFDIAGTSDSVYATFTVPYTAKTSGLDFVGSCEGVDAGTACLTNFRLPANSSTVSVYKANIDANWTASGTKAVRGQFFYEAAS